MSSSSSSLLVSTSRIKFDVFLSFRGEDTRENFTSHLYKALQKKKIRTFMDDQLNRGYEISPLLVEAIEGSKISVVIFSQNYANSKWCVEELVKILDCRDAVNQTVIPVFYKVDPTDVRNQTGNFGSEFDKLVKKYEIRWGISIVHWICSCFQNVEASESVIKEDRWRHALKKVGTLSGWPSSIFRSEAMLVDTIVADVLEKLTIGSDSYSDLTGLVGINSRIEKIMPLLCLESPKFGMVGIWGMGGTGKTTIAEAIFNKISNNFESSYFQANVGDVERKGDLVRVKAELFSKLLEEENLLRGTPGIQHAYTRDRLRRKKVLIVLDDVTTPSQVRDLLGRTDQFGPGSRVIVTTRNKQVLSSYDMAIVYEMEVLHDEEALQLFCYHSFGKTQPPEKFWEFSKTVVRYAKGVALALVVIGSALRGKSESHWKSALRKLMKIPDMGILHVLKISFDSLDCEEKEIFLDIACFFRSMTTRSVTEILDFCYYSLHSGIEVLVDKCLITIRTTRNRKQVFAMHDLLQEMGWNVVVEESKKVGSRSRLWRPEDAHHVLIRNTGTEKIKGLFFDVSGVKKICLDADVFSKMHSLKLLSLDTSHRFRHPNVHFPSGLKSLPDELRYLSWYNCTLDSLPSTFRPNNLVKLDMSYSHLKRIWTGTQNLECLKSLNLQHSKKLVEIPDLSLAMNLEELNICNCTSLEDISLSLGHLNNLASLNLGGCTKLRKLPTGINLTSLTQLDLRDCNKITEFPEISTNLEILNLCNCTSLLEIPSSIKHLTNLTSLDLSGCAGLRRLPSFVNLSSLKYLNLAACNKITELPEISKNLEKLDLYNCTSLVEIPSFTSLRTLNLRGCKKITKFPEISQNIESLEVDMTSVEEVPSRIARSLQSLTLWNCTKLQKSPIFLEKLKLLIPETCHFGIFSDDEMMYPSNVTPYSARNEFLILVGCL